MEAVTWTEVATRMEVVTRMEAQTVTRTEEAMTTEVATRTEVATWTETPRWKVGTETRGQLTGSDRAAEPPAPRLAAASYPHRLLRLARRFWATRLSSEFSAACVPRAHSLMVSTGYVSRYKK
jgi:hypothetical protein